MIQCQPDLDIVGVFPASMANQWKHQPAINGNWQWPIISASMA
jgi:hypothetical protein